MQKSDRREANVMSSDRPASLPSLPRRWRLSRKSRYFALLVAISIAGYWLLPWIFIPADLRAMQGTWKVLELQGDGEEAPENATIIISGNRVALRDDPADSERITATYTIELHSARREMRLHPPQ